MDDLFNILTGLLIIIGAAFPLIAAVGILRLPDLYTRMHAASKGIFVKNRMLPRGTRKRIACMLHT